MIKLAKKRGYVTMDEINDVLPSEQVDADQIEDVLAMFSEMGINVVESEEAESEEEEEAAPPPPPTRRRPRAARSSRSTGTRTPARSETAKEPTDRTDDPVRMYLREMGSVELLSREGEIAIAKRIEAGREAMIAGLCESPLTFQAIIIWRDELNDGKILLRDIIDLEATYAGPDGKNAPVVPADRGRGRGASPPPPRRRRRRRGRLPPIEGDLDEDDMENNVSLSAMEAELKPKVLETFDRIADNYKKLRRLQDVNVENRMQNKTLSPSQERKYKKLKDEIVGDVKLAVAQPGPHRCAGRAALRHQQAADHAPRAA